MMDNLWTRRTNSSKLSLSTGNAGTNGVAPQNDHPTRNYTLGRRGDTSSHSNKNPFNSVSVSSPTAGASSAFGLGSGAFASFGASKTPKTPGSTMDFGNVVGSSAKTPTAEKTSKLVTANSSKTSLNDSKPATTAVAAHPLRYGWAFWYRPPISKSNGYVNDYEKTINEIAAVDTVEDFYKIYTHLKRPSALPAVSDYHLFKRGIRPIWEDDDNKNGGKWILRLKKGVADRYWEDILLALIGDQFVETSEEICGAVLSVRNGEDILSIWSRDERGRVLKIRDAMKALLDLPPNTKIDWKAHDQSLQQRAAADEARKERSIQHNHHSTTQNGSKEDDPAFTFSDKKQAS